MIGGGLASKYQTDVCINKFIADWLNLGGQIGVGCFLLISGYFMVDQSFQLKRIFRLLGEVWFYTISCWLFYIIIQLVMGSNSTAEILRQTVNAVFPVMFSHYWFVSAYVILMFLSPFFNRLIAAMDQHTYQLFLTVLISIFCVIIGGMKLLSGMSEGRLIPVFIMYFVAGYIKKYVDHSKHNSKKHLKIAILGYVILYASVVGIDLLGAALNSERIIGYCTIWRPLNSPIVLMINVELFLAFLHMKPFHNKAVNLVASGTFGVYLIHGNSIISGKVLTRLFPMYLITDSFKLFWYAMWSVAMVYVGCTLIDLVRQRTVEKIWIRLLDARFDDWITNIQSRIKVGYRKVLYLLNKYYG